MKNSGKREPDHNQKSCVCGHGHHEEHICGCGREHHEEHTCGCGHEHHEDHDHACCHSHSEDYGCGCGCGHDHAHHAENERGEKRELLIGAVLFAVGLLLSALVPELPLALPVYIVAWLVLGWGVITAAVKNLCRGRLFDENFLMTLATVGAFLIGEFPEAVGVMLFYRVGEFFEHRAVARSRSSILEAVDLRPETVELTTGEVIPADHAKVGDILQIRPGDRIPLDSRVISGSSRINTAPITGESVPVAVKAGDSVISGCINTDGLLTVQVEKVLSESMVTRILNSVENAAASKPKIDRFITRFSRVYTPVVVALAAAVALIPSLITGDWSYWVYTALSFLVMSCPCALVLSVPLSFFSGIGAGSKQGILFKGGLAIEALAGVKAVAMDKTGTLTQGDFRVQETNCDDRLLQLCASCESGSQHPIAASITAAAAERGLLTEKPQALEEFSGQGVWGRVHGKTVLCGNRALLERFGVTVGQLPELDHGTRVLVAVDGEYGGSIVISDTVKPEAAAAVSRLEAMGIQTAMLTGDAQTAAGAVAKQTGIRRVFAALLPDEKLLCLQKLRERYGPVMFVGDGINDAPVLSGADVGAAMGTGADAAIEAADVVFMTSCADAIPQALDIARRTRAIAWQNVVFALTVKLGVMVLGLLGCASMWAAVFADSGVAMLCVLNSVRQLYRK